MAENNTDSNMYRVERVVLQPDSDELSADTASKALSAAGLGQQQMDPDELEAYIDYWEASDRWIVTRSSSIHQGELRVGFVEGISEYARAATAYVQTQSWHNEMMETVECPECGLERVRLALHGHQNSRRCRAQQNHNEVKERGLRPVRNQSKHLKELIREHSEVGIEEIRTKYVRGSQNERSSLRSVSYATPEGIQRAKEEYLPAAVSRAGGSVERARIVWRDEEHCIVLNDETMHVVDVENPARIYRRRSLYLSTHSGTLVAYNSDGWRVGTLIPKFAGRIINQHWRSDHAVLKVATDEGCEQTVELPHPVDVAIREPCFPDEYDSLEEAIENEADIDFVHQSCSAAFIPGQVVAAENGVVVDV